MPYETPEEREDRESEESRRNAQAYWAKKKKLEDRDSRDIVDKLRGSYSGDESRMNLMHYCDLAANEIERLRRIETASKQVLSGLDQRIDAAPPEAKPVFHGIVELHNAILAPTN